MNRLFGILLLVLGTVYLLHNTGVIDVGTENLIGTYWPLLIVALGLKNVIDGLGETIKSAKRGNWNINDLFWGCMITAVGMVLLGTRTGWYTFTFTDLWGLVWPLILIYIGLQIFLNREEEVQVYYPGKEEHDEKINIHNEEVNEEINRGKEKAAKKRKYTSNKYDKTTNRQFIGETSIGKRPWRLDNRKIHTTVGSAEIDLTTAILEDGENHLDINVWIGSIEVAVPPDMAIEIYANVNIGEVNIFNESTGGTGRHASYVSDNFEEADKKVILHIQTNVGSVEVMHVG